LISTVQREDVFYQVALSPGKKYLLRKEKLSSMQRILRTKPLFLETKALFLQTKALFTETQVLF